MHSSARRCAPKQGPGGLPCALACCCPLFLLFPPSSLLKGCVCTLPARARWAPRPWPASPGFPSTEAPIPEVGFSVTSESPSRIVAQTAISGCLGAGKGVDRRSHIRDVQSSGFPESESSQKCAPVTTVSSSVDSLSCLLTYYFLKIGLPYTHPFPISFLIINYVADVVPCQYV